MKDLLNFYYFVRYIWQGNGKQIAEYVKDLKDCTMKWYEQNEKSHFLEEERLRTAIDLTEKKCSDTGKLVTLFLKPAVVVV